MTPDFGSAVSTLYDAEPFEREISPAEQNRLGDIQRENKKVLDEGREILDALHLWAIGAKMTLNEVMWEINPDNLDDFYRDLSCMESENKGLV